MTPAAGRREGVEGRLSALGVNPAEERLYRRLLQIGPVSMGGLSAALGQPPAELDPAVRALARRGLVTAAADGSGRWCALPPQSAVEPLIRRRERELADARQALLALVAEHTTASRAPQGGPVELLDNAGLTRRWAEVEAAVAKEMLVLSKAPLVRHADRTEEVLTLLERRVECRCVYDRSALDQPGSLRSVNRFHAAGEQVRVADRLPMKMMVADRQVALVPVGPRLPGSWLMIRQSDLLDGLVTLFELVWSRSVPFRGEQEREGAGALPPDEDAQLLSMLVGGMTDAAIGRQTGTSVRTVQRRVNRLMQRAGVHSRAQLAWQSARQTRLGEWADEE
ncbi:MULTISPECIES: hypothetical protein [unclassified Streptomyces]|uniref:hypothetical protein n=1 Tax=unclassified Streptomyces TaxID=2593676 RepID=UPI0035D7CB32